MKFKNIILKKKKKKKKKNNKKKKKKKGQEVGNAISNCHIPINQRYILV